MPHFTPVTLGLSINFAQKIPEEQLKEYPWGFLLEKIHANQLNGTSVVVRSKLKAEQLNDEPSPMQGLFHFIVNKQFVQLEDYIYKIRASDDFELMSPAHATPPTYEDYKALITCLAKNYANRPLYDVLSIRPEKPLLYEKWQAVIEALMMKVQSEMKADPADSKFLTEATSDVQPIAVEMMEALGIALNRRQDAESLILQGCGLTNDHLAALLPFLETATIGLLDLTGNDIDDGQFSEQIETLRENLLTINL